MSNAEGTSSAPTSPPPLSWPPPGLEQIQGKLWRVIGLSWIGSVILVLPLLWELATEQPFSSLGPFEGNWEVGFGITVIGLAVLFAASAVFYGLLRLAADAARRGYGTLTILEVMADVTRDTGFLIQGRRHFEELDEERRAGVVRARMRGAAFLLGGALYMAAGFSLSVLLAARGFVTPSGIWLMTLGPTAVMLFLGFVVLFFANGQAREARLRWEADEGDERAAEEAAAWSERLDAAGDAVALGSGPKGESGRFLRGAWGVVILFIFVLVPTLTIAITAGIGPILAEIAVPEFRSVQTMAGGIEALRRYRLEEDPSIPPGRAGEALQNLAFVGARPAPEPMERAPATVYETGWFPDPNRFPDPFSETVASDLMATPLSQFTAEQRAALQQAAAHPAHAEFHLLARAHLVDVVSGRWVLPFPDTLSFDALPWPRFAALRTAGLAQVARASVELSRGERARAEQTLTELISTGILLIDQGPTLLDNLVGVVLANMGGDAMEQFYARTGREADARALRWARDAAVRGARRARAGHTGEDIRSLLSGIPKLVEQEDALRGLRWEYLATFSSLAPCINLQKMVFGPDETYNEWMISARDALVRVQGERALFDLASGNASLADKRPLEGFLPRFLSLTLGSRGRPGSCAALIERIEKGG